MHSRLHSHSRIAPLHARAIMSVAMRTRARTYATSGPPRLAMHMSHVTAHAVRAHAVRAINDTIADVTLGSLPPDIYDALGPMRSSSHSLSRSSARDDAMADADADADDAPDDPDSDDVLDALDYDDSAEDDENGYEDVSATRGALGGAAAAPSHSNAHANANANASASASANARANAIFGSAQSTALPRRESIFARGAGAYDLNGGNIDDDDDDDNNHPHVLEMSIAPGAALLMAGDRRATSLHEAQALAAACLISRAQEEPREIEWERLSDLLVAAAFTSSANTFDAWLSRVRRHIAHKRLGM